MARRLLLMRRNSAGALVVVGSGGRQSRWVRVSELVSRGGVLPGRGRGPRRDDEWCLINPFVLGARADVVLHLTHDALVPWGL